MLELPAKSVLAGSMAALLYGAPVLFIANIFAGFGSRMFAAILGAGALVGSLATWRITAWEQRRWQRDRERAFRPRRPAALEVGPPMPHYVSLMRWTSKGVAGLPAWRERVDEGERIVEEAGGKLVGVYVTLGRYDVVEIFEARDDDTAAEILMKLQRHGAEHTETLRAFTREEAEAIVKRL